MSFNDYLKTTPTELDRRLDTYLRQWLHDMGVYAPVVQTLGESFAKACQGGKRLRGTLVTLGYDMFAAADPRPDALYQASLAYEVFQAAILAHDDVIDKSPLRRGQPTLFKMLETRCRSSNDNAADFALHYGISQTICLGDMGLFMAIQLLSDSAFDPALKNRATSFFTQIVIDTIAGQIIDVELPYMADITQVTSDDLLSICRYKTARYTITGPLTLGAILAKASTERLPALATYGDNLGIAFQLKDDLLGVFADETTIGKSVTSDIEEGKMTLLYFHALQHANATQRAQLEQHYGTGPITPATHTLIKQILTDTGARAFVENLMQQFADKAIAAIQHVTDNGDYRTILDNLADFMIKREK